MLKTSANSRLIRCAQRLRNAAAYAVGAAGPDSGKELGARPHPRQAAPPGAHRLRWPPGGRSQTRAAAARMKPVTTGCLGIGWHVGFVESCWIRRVVRQGRGAAMGGGICEEGDLLRSVTGRHAIISFAVPLSVCVYTSCLTLTFQACHSSYHGCKGIPCCTCSLQAINDIR